MLHLSFFSAVGSLFEVAGLGLAVTLLLGSRSDAASLLVALNLPLPAGLGVLVAVVLLRCQLQARVAISQERLRSGFTDQLSVMSAH